LIFGDLTPLLFVTPLLFASAFSDPSAFCYAYDNGGLLNAAWGEKRGNRYNYINSLTYDEFGQRRHIGYGNGVQSSYSYDDKTRRLESLIASTPEGRTMQNILILILRCR
jgi:hypothetical protein